MAQISIITPMLLHLNPSEHHFFVTGEQIGALQSRIYQLLFYSPGPMGRAFTSICISETQLLENLNGTDRADLYMANQVHQPGGKKHWQNSSLALKWALSDPKMSQVLTTTQRETFLLLPMLTICGMMDPMVTSHGPPARLQRDLTARILNGWPRGNRLITLAWILYRMMFAPTLT